MGAGMNTKLCVGAVKWRELSSFTVELIKEYRATPQSKACVVINSYTFNKSQETAYDISVRLVKVILTNGAPLSFHIHFHSSLVLTRSSDKASNQF